MTWTVPPRKILMVRDALPAVPPQVRNHAGRNRPAPTASAYRRAVVAACSQHAASAASGRQPFRYALNDDRTAWLAETVLRAGTRTAPRARCRPLATAVRPTRQSATEPERPGPRASTTRAAGTMPRWATACSRLLPSAGAEWIRRFLPGSALIQFTQLAHFFAPGHARRSWKAIEVQRESAGRRVAVTTTRSS